MVKDGGALERLAEVDRSSSTRPARSPAACRSWSMPTRIAPERWRWPPRMASRSRHPYSQAIAAEGSRRQLPAVALTDLGEHPGPVSRRGSATVYRLGRADWALPRTRRCPGVMLSEDGRLLCRFAFEDELRAGAVEAVAALRRRACLSRSSPAITRSRCVASPRRSTCRASRRVAGGKGRPHRRAGGSGPQGPDGRRRPQRRAGPCRGACLDGAGSAADIGRTAADFVFLRDDLAAVPQAIAIAPRAATWSARTCCSPSPTTRWPCRSPSSGHVTPLVAAIAMSASSILVVANALRLGGDRARRPAARFRP